MKPWICNHPILYLLKIMHMPFTTVPRNSSSCCAYLTITNTGKWSQLPQDYTREILERDQIQGMSNLSTFTYSVFTLQLCQEYVIKNLCTGLYIYIQREMYINTNILGKLVFASILVWLTCLHVSTFNTAYILDRGTNTWPLFDRKTN